MTSSDKYRSTILCAGNKLIDYLQEFLTEFYPSGDYYSIASVNTVRSWFRGDNIISDSYWHKLKNNSKIAPLRLERKARFDELSANIEHYQPMAREERKRFGRSHSIWNYYSNELIFRDYLKSIEREINYFDIHQEREKDYLNYALSLFKIGKWDDLLEWSTQLKIRIRPNIGNFLALCYLPAKIYIRRGEHLLASREIAEIENLVPLSSDLPARSIACVLKAEQEHLSYVNGEGGKSTEAIKMIGNMRSNFRSLPSPFNLIVGNTVANILREGNQQQRSESRQIHTYIAKKENGAFRLFSSVGNWNIMETDIYDNKLDAVKHQLRADFGSYILDELSDYKDACPILGLLLIQSPDPKHQAFARVLKNTYNEICRVLQINYRSRVYAVFAENLDKRC